MHVSVSRALRGCRHLMESRAGGAIASLCGKSPGSVGICLCHVPGGADAKAAPASLAPLSSLTAAPCISAQDLFSFMIVSLPLSLLFPSLPPRLSLSLPPPPFRLPLSPSPPPSPCCCQRSPLPFPSFALFVAGILAACWTCTVINIS